MKIPQPPIYDDPGAFEWKEWFRIMREAVLQLSQESDTVPSSVNYKAGSFFKNSSPVESGSVGSKYIVFGWVLVSGAWKECRVLTGN